MLDRKNSSVVITGAANGLGKALATEFYRLGYRLALIDIDNIGLAKLKQELAAKDDNVTIYEADISTEQAIVSAHKAILNDHHHINILLNNAAISNSQPFEQMDITNFHKLFAVNFWGTVYCTKYFLPYLKKESHSRLVNIVSDFALMGFPGKTTYGSSKSAVMGFTYSLKTELADTSVKVCLVIPPPLDTGLVKNSIHIDEDKKQREAEFLRKNGMPLEKAAIKIVRQIEKGKFRIIIGPMMFWIDFSSRLFPTALHKALAKRKNKFDFV